MALPPVTAMLVLAVAGTADDALPDPKAPPMVRMTDVFPAEPAKAALDAWRAAAAKLDDRAGRDVPWDLPLEEQKSRYRRVDPTRGITFIDMGTAELDAGSDYAKAFDALKAAARPPS